MVDLSYKPNYGFTDNNFGFDTLNSLMGGGGPTAPLGTMGSGNFQPDFWDKMVGYTNPETQMQNAGWGGLALGAANGIFNGWLGLEKLDVAKKTLAENKRQFNKNWEAQKGMVNSDLEARQRARVRNRPGVYRSVGEYMDQYGVK